MGKRKIPQKQNEVIIGNDTSNYFQTTAQASYSLKNATPEKPTRVTRRTGNVSTFSFGEDTENRFYNKYETKEHDNVAHNRIKEGKRNKELLSKSSIVFDMTDEQVPTKSVSQSMLYAMDCKKVEPKKFTPTLSPRRYNIITGKELKEELIVDPLKNPKIRRKMDAGVQRNFNIITNETTDK